MTREHPFIPKIQNTSAQVTKTISKHSIEAFVARLMKSNRKLDYEKILEKTRKRFENIEGPKVYDAVQSLLSSHIIKPEQGFANVYVYN